MTSQPYPRETFDKPGSLHRKARIRFRSPEGPAELVGALKVMARCFRCMADALDVIVRNTESEEDRGDMAVTMPEWWQCEASLPTNPKVAALRDALKVDYLKAVGVVACFFSGVCEHTPNGDLTTTSDSAIALWCHWRYEETGT